MYCGVITSSRSSNTSTTLSLSQVSYSSSFWQRAKFKLLQHRPVINHLVRNVPLKIVKIAFTNSQRPQLCV